MDKKENTPVIGDDGINISGNLDVDLSRIKELKTDDFPDHSAREGFVLCYIFPRYAERCRSPEDLEYLFDKLFSIFENRDIGGAYAKALQNMYVVLLSKFERISGDTFGRLLNKVPRLREFVSQGRDVENMDALLNVKTTPFDRRFGIGISGLRDSDTFSSEVISLKEARAGVKNKRIRLPLWKFDVAIDLPPFLPHGMVYGLKGLGKNREGDHFVGMIILDIERRISENLFIFRESGRCGLIHESSRDAERRKIVSDAVHQNIEIINTDSYFLKYLDGDETGLPENSFNLDCLIWRGDKGCGLLKDGRVVTDRVYDKIIKLTCLHYLCVTGNSYCVFSNTLYMGGDNYRTAGPYPLAGALTFENLLSSLEANDIELYNLMTQREFIVKAGADYIVEYSRFYSRYDTLQVEEKRVYLIMDNEFNIKGRFDREDDAQ